jgi:hypothetical protein
MMSAEERQSVMEKRKVFIADEDSPRLEGGFAICIDDSEVTGHHRLKVEAALSNTGLAGYLHIALLRIVSGVNGFDPTIEEFLNRAAIKDLDDLALMFNEVGNPIINGRVLKLLLNDDEACPAQVESFVDKVGEPIARDILKLASSIEGYDEHYKRQYNFEVLQSLLR